MSFATAVVLAVCVCTCTVHGSSGLERSAVANSILEDEAWIQLDLLRQISDSQEYLERSYGSPAHRSAAEQIQAWMQQAGMQTHIDAIGNVHGVLKGSSVVGGALALGSHYDSVRDAGAFDGPLGIITPIAAVKALVATSAACKDVVAGFNTHGTKSGSHASQPPSEDEDFQFVDVSGCVEDFKAGPGEHMHVRVIAFTDEEGMRFQSTFLGSRAVTGTLTGEMLQTRDAFGLTIGETLYLPECSKKGSCPHPTPAQQLAALKLPQGSVRAYVEAHLEQGPVLEASGMPVGVVAAIAGQSRWLVTVQGEQGHAGTVPMHLRKDPLPVASIIVHALSEYCMKGIWGADLPFPFSLLPASLQATISRAASTLPSWLLQWLPGLSQIAERGSTPHAYLVCTVGKMTLWPGVSNVIPKHANFTVDLRSDDDGVREKVETWLQGEVAKACAAAGMLECSSIKQHAAERVKSSSDLTDTIVTSVERALESHAARGYGGGGVWPADAVATGTAVSVSSGDADSDVEVSAGSNDVQIMTSGAGHDALAMAEMAPVAMLFVRCRDGLSHHPDEFVSKADVAVATRVLFELVGSDSAASDGRDGEDGSDWWQQWQEELKEWDARMHVATEDASECNGTGSCVDQGQAAPLKHEPRRWSDFQ